MFYNYKNCAIKLNGRDIYASDASISIQSSDEPNYLIGQRHSFDYTPSNGIGGRLSLNYYLTGADFLKEYITNETGVISGNFGGLSFKSGYLTSYGFKSSPNRPVLISANINFFDALSGVFSPTYAKIEETQTLNFANAAITTQNGNTIGNIDNIVGFDYGFNSDVKPVYLIGQTIPESVAFGIKTVDSSIQCDNLSGDLSIYGKTSVLNISLVHPYNSSISESFGVSGILYQREISTSAGQSLLSNLSIKQNFVENAPVISNFYPAAGNPGSKVAILGQYFTTANSVIFNDLPDTTFSITDDGHITGTVPQGAITGPIKIRNLGGESSSSTNFTVNQLPITVTGLSPIVGNFGQNIRISGTNFYRIDKIQFVSGNSPSFNVINPILIDATVPNSAAWGKITVSSIDRLLTATSPMEFVPNPIITNFIPTSGYSQDTVIISGGGLDGITGVTFNNLPNLTPYTTTFTGLSNNTISALVPTGNTQGFIRLFGRSGVMALSVTEFSPLARITGLNPDAAKTGDIISLLGVNFFANILYPVDTKYLVTFNDFSGLFSLTNDATLSGLVPTGAKSGPVFLHKSDISTYPGTGTFKLLYGAPSISQLIPNSGAPGNSTAIIGDKFFNVTGVRFSGITGMFYIESPSVSTQGNYINVTIPNTSGGMYGVIVNTTGGQGSLSNAIRVLGNGYFSGFIPTSGFPGDLIFLTGENIYNNSKIFLNHTGYEAAVDNNSYNSTFSQLTFTIPSNVPSNPNVVLYNGVNYYTGGVLSTFNKPEASGFLPLTGSWNDLVVITGNYLNITSGIFLGSTLISSFNKVSTTGLNFSIPENTVTNTIDLYSRAGITKSQIQLVVNPLSPIFSGFSPTGQRVGGEIVISGQRLNTVYEVHISGQNSTGIILYEELEKLGFRKVNNTGIILNVPELTQSNNTISIVNVKSEVTSSNNLILLYDPIIKAITPQSGVFGQTIIVSGQNISGNMSFYFAGASSGFLVKALSSSIVGGTGASIRIPRGIISSGIIVTGDNGLGNISVPIFTPLPTISGFDSSIVNTGSVLTITGINATELYPFIAATGKNNLYKNIFNTIFTDSNTLTGNNIVDLTTGYTIISGIVNDQFFYTGKLFLRSKFDIDGFSINNNESNLLSSQTISIIPSTTQINGVIPFSGYTGTNVIINGIALSYITGLSLVNGTTVITGNIISQSYSTLVFNPPTGSITSSSGFIRLISDFTTTTSSTGFTYIQEPYISGITTDFAPSGSVIGISGSGMRFVTGIYFGSTRADFTGYNVGPEFILSGTVPYITDVLPKKSEITVVSPAGSYKFTQQKFQTEWGTQGFSGDVNILNNLTVRNTGLIGTIVGGSGNGITTNKYSASAILGGNSNTINGTYSSICGGTQNVNNATAGCIAGGFQNRIEKQDLSSILNNLMFIGGGTLNITSGINTSILNGASNQVYNDYSFILGGTSNVIGFNFKDLGQLNFIANGTSNQIPNIGGVLADNSQYSFILNGQNNIINPSFRSHILNGYGHNISGQYSEITNGYTNIVVADYSDISNGYTNTIGYNLGTSSFCNILNGLLNTISGDKSIILNGYNNKISGNYQLIGGGGNNSTIKEFATIINGSGNYCSGKISTIINGILNTGLSDNLLIVGSGNIIKSSGHHSQIIGGSNNIIYDGLDSNSYYNTIIGGDNNCISGGSNFVVGASPTTNPNHVTGYSNSVLGARGGNKIFNKDLSNSNCILGYNNEITGARNHIIGVAGRIPNQQGAVMLLDGNETPHKYSAGPNTLTVNFQSGAYFSGTDINLDKTIFNSGIAINPITRYIKSGIVYHPDNFKTLGFNHGLGGTPDMAQWFLVCTGSDLGYSNNDEVEVDEFYNQFDTAAALIPWKNSTGVAITITNGNVRIYSRNAYTLSNIATGQWQLKVVAIKTY